VRSRASSFKWGYPLLSLRSSSSFLRLLPCLPVTSIPSCIFLSVEYIYIYIFHLAVCLTTGPKPLPKPALHIVRSRASSFKWGYPLLSLRSSNSFLRLLHCLPVTSIPPCIFPSITRCRRQFLRTVPWWKIVELYLHFNTSYPWMAYKRTILPFNIRYQRSPLGMNYS
jgi:hypothetical protein